MIQTPMTCSGTCSIASTISENNCDDNGTPFDPSDDIFYFDVVIVGSNTGSGWIDNFGNTGDYGVVSTLGPFQIADGSFNIVFSDESDPNCITVSSIIPPDPCSDECQIIVDIIDIYCDDNGSGSNPSDDLFYAQIENKWD